MLWDKDGSGTADDTEIYSAAEILDDLFQCKSRLLTIFADFSNSGQIFSELKKKPKNFFQNLILFTNDDSTNHDFTNHDSTNHDFTNDDSTTDDSTKFSFNLREFLRMDWNRQCVPEIIRKFVRFFKTLLLRVHI